MLISFHPSDFYSPVLYATHNRCLKRFFLVSMAWQGFKMFDVQLTGRLKFRIFCKLYLVSVKRRVGYLFVAVSTEQSLPAAFPSIRRRLVRKRLGHSVTVSHHIRIRINIRLAYPNIFRILTSRFISRKGWIQIRLDSDTEIVSTRNHY